jgi:hypothetical protein
MLNRYLASKEPFGRFDLIAFSTPFMPINGFMWEKSLTGPFQKEYHKAIPQLTRGPLQTLKAT